jgi:outer membrane receptor for ferric coprogen and ferric-rhodotorulic acid
LPAVATLQAYAQQPASPETKSDKKVPIESVAPVTTTASEDEDLLVLSPFTVDTKRDKGYYAENTLAGSRMSSNLGDLASSITVITKQQLEDTASLDINDVFRYEANTEGSHSYTPLVLEHILFI